jgi:adenylate cyclase
MIFSLQRRFFLLLLLPVALILIATALAGFFWARSHLMEEWQVSTSLVLDKAVHQISMRLDEKLELIRLIGKAEEIPGSGVTSAFLIQELARQEGVRLVDVESTGSDTPKEGPERAAANVTSGSAEGLYTLGICPDFSFCGPILDPEAPDRSLTVVKVLSTKEDGTVKRLVLRISFDSFLDPIRQMRLWPGSTAMLVTDTGQFLASTDKSFADRKKLGDNGDRLEAEVLTEMGLKSFGSVRGIGHPPDRVIAFGKVPSLNWHVLVISRGEEIFRPLVHFRSYYVLAGLLSLGMILLLIRLATQSVVTSISDISSAAARVRNGDYSVKLSEHASDEIGQLIRSFNAMTQGLKERDLIEQTFGRYVDKQVAEELMSRPEALRLGGEKRTVTIMMSDLRDFTPMSEKLQPEEVIKMLNRYFSRMVAVIEKHRGIIVDFYGDSVLVFFNGAKSDIAVRAVDAVQCALEMQRELGGFVKDNLAKGLPEVAMGIGIHTGEVVVGNIGTETRAKYGIVGANVNLTDRIQYAAGPGKVVVSEETYTNIQEWLTVSQEFTVCLKGVEGEKRLYEVEAVR